MTIQTPNWNLKIFRNKINYLLFKPTIQLITHQLKVKWNKFKNKINHLKINNNKTQKHNNKTLMKINNKTLMKIYNKILQKMQIRIINRNQMIQISNKVLLLLLKWLKMIT